MTLLHFNMITVTLCALLLIGGFSARAHKLSGVAMIAGLIGLMLVIAANLQVMLRG